MRFLSILLAVLFLSGFTFVGCGDETDPGTDATENGVEENGENGEAEENGEEGEAEENGEEGEAEENGDDE